MEFDCCSSFGEFLGYPLKAIISRCSHDEIVFCDRFAGKKWLLTFFAGCQITFL